MNKYNIQIRRVDTAYFSSLLLDPTLIGQTFIDQYTNRRGWRQFHSLYLLEEGRVLDLEKTFYENGILSGDHLIVF